MENSFSRIENHPNLDLIEYNLLDTSNSVRVLSTIQPDEVYNLAAQSFVGVSFEQPLVTSHTTGIGAVNLLEAIRIVNQKSNFTKLLHRKCLVRFRKFLKQN